MASRRKSTTPCMVLPSNVMEEQDADMQVEEGKDGAESAAEGLTDTAVVSTDPETEHDISHSSGEDGVTCTGGKRSNQPTLEQTLSDLLSDGGYTQHETEESDDPASAGISLSKTPIMKMRGKSEPKRIAVSLKAAEESDGMGESEGEQEPIEAPLGLGSLTPVEKMSPHYTESMKHSVLLNIPNMMSSEHKKSSVLSSNMSGLQLPPGLAQVLSALQAQQSAQAQLLIPVSSIPSYNQSMDTNTVLVNTYKKFPYPSVSEIMGLSAQTKFSEEQIKIWFSAQRLKHGVSWTPEEVEEARRKQFNGTVHTVPQTITVIPAHQLSAAANGLQSILQTCQIVGQPGLVFTQVGTPVTTPITLTVAGMPSHSLVPKMSSHQTSPAVSEMKRATTVQPPSLTPQENSALSADHFGMRPKKSKEQLAELKASYLKNHFASDAEIARLMMLTCLTKGEIKKWFSDTRYNQRNSKNSNVIVFHDSQSPRGHGSGTTIVIDSSDETPQSPPPTPSVKEKEPRPKTWNSFPDFTLQKFKEKTAEQLVVLEESYQKGSTPSDDELTRLRTETKLTRREIDAWFTEKRKVVEAESPELKAERMESEATSSRKRSQTPPCGRRPNRGDKNIGKKTPEQLHVLKSAFVRTQWPSTEEYDKLAEESGLPRVYVVNWFGDTRYSFKNGNLKWFFHYQSGNVEGLNGNKNRKRRIRNRGWGRSRSRKAKRSTSTEKSPPLPLIKLKSGKDILKEYYLKHKLLNEQDLDELVTKSSMGYEQVREWFAEVHKREDMGADPFGDVEVNEDQQEEEVLLGENEMAPDEQDDTVVGEEDEEEEEEDDDTDESDSWEPSQGARKTQSE
ncbi:zinc fingers and homeoboxes protein 1 [Oncorhynchus kisutch]|uniref:zinc fingers and homeoboxes protein 1 n=1 Tax=Oncorhynchus kisutch TaxID=8019 RepID=UPI0012DCE3E7|nr:zinc fingers and homeoboxes protein 1 [Oncorhynchus kisutch]